MIKVTLPDGAVKEYEKGITPIQVAQSISEGLARNVISAQVNGKTVETITPINTDANVTLFTHGIIRKEKKPFGILLLAY